MLRLSVITAVGSSSLLMSHRMGHNGGKCSCQGTNSNLQQEQVKTYFVDDRSMKRIHFIRHAEGEHNVAGKNNPLGYLRQDLVDANLSKFGVQQCNDFATDPSKSNIVQSAELLVVSPMNRTLQTASYCFPSLINRIPWIAIENLRETTGLHPCDKRLTITQHKESYGHVDFEGIAHDADPMYHLYTLREPHEDVRRRCREFLQWLRSRPEKDIIIVTHSAYLREMVGAVLEIENSPNHEIRFQNCECRTYIVTLPPVPPGAEGVM
jgi:broad specificity phosphatase PhoE